MELGGTQSVKDTEVVQKMVILLSFKLLLLADPHHRQREGLLLQALSSVKQDKSQNFHRLSQAHFISQDPTGPLHTRQGKFSD